MSEVDIVATILAANFFERDEDEHEAVARLICYDINDAEDPEPFCECTGPMD